jgi:hypothetical protein
LFCGKTYCFSRRTWSPRVRRFFSSAAKRASGVRNLGFVHNNYFEAATLAHIMTVKRRNADEGFEAYTVCPFVGQQAKHSTTALGAVPFMRHPIGEDACRVLDVGRFDCPKTFADVFHFAPSSS